MYACRTLVLSCLAGILAAPSPLSAQAGQSTVKEDSVTLYSGMSSSSDVVKTLKKGDAVTVDFSIATPEGSWCSVVEEGRQEPSGYVPCRVLDRAEPPSPAPGHSSTAVGERVRFRFDPPAGTFIQRQRVTQVKRMGTQQQTNFGDTATRVTIRRISRGYSIEQTVVSAEMNRGGNPIPDSFTSLIKGSTVTYRVDRNGRLLAVEGSEAALNKLKQSLPPQAADLFSSLLSDRAVRARIEAEWAARVSSFSGMEAAIGESWTQKQAIPLPIGGSAPFEVTTRLLERVRCGAEDCVRLAFYAESTDDTLKEFLGRVIGGLSRATGAPFRIELQKASMTIQGHRLVNPATLMTYSEAMQRTIHMEVQLPNGSVVPAVLDEVRELTSDRVQ